MRNAWGEGTAGSMGFVRGPSCQSKQIIGLREGSGNETSLKKAAGEPNITAMADRKDSCGRVAQNQHNYAQRRQRRTGFFNKKNPSSRIRPGKPMLIPL